MHRVLITKIDEHFSLHVLNKYPPLYDALYKVSTDFCSNGYQAIPIFVQQGVDHFRIHNAQCVREAIEGMHMRYIGPLD